MRWRVYMKPQTKLRPVRFAFCFNTQRWRESDFAPFGQSQSLCSTNWWIFTASYSDGQTWKRHWSANLLTKCVCPPPPRKGLQITPSNADLYTYGTRLNSHSLHAHNHLPSSPGMSGPLSELDLHLTRPLQYQRNRTPVEYEAACSAHFNPRSAALTSHHCPSALLAPQHSVTQQPRAKVPPSDLGCVTDPLDKNVKPSSLQESKDRTVH